MGEVLVTVGIGWVAVMIWLALLWGINRTTGLS